MQIFSRFIFQLTILASCFLVYANPQAAAQDPLAQITTFSEAHLAAMEEARRNAPSVGILAYSSEVASRALEYQAMLKEQGVPAVADQLLAVYPADEASRDYAAVTLAFLIDANYTYKIRTEDRGLTRKIETKGDPDPEKLAAGVLPLVDEIAKRNDPHAASAAVELLLQAVCDTLGSGHLEADNGRRKDPPIPEALAVRAADFLDHPDPLVRTMAEWTISVKVSIDNDREGAVWPGDTPPEWFTKWIALPAETHLPMDYLRQAITLGMHRRGADLLTLAADVKRRAAEKARWAAENFGGSTEALDTMETAFAALEKAVTENPTDLAAARNAWLAWRVTVRPVVLRSADIDFQRIVYLKRYSGGHHIQPTIHSNKYPAGGDIFVQDGLEPTSPTRTLIGDQLPEGYVQDLDLWFDADRLVFSRTTGPNRNANQKLYRMDLDGQNLRQLTDGAYQDVDPAWLPDGSVVFGSTRSQAGIMCGSASSQHTNIYRLMPDGEKIIRLSYNKDDDAYPYVLNDGRVVYMRWDYQERGVDEIFSLWVVRPDGSGSDGFYRVHINDSLIIQALKDPQPIPGTQKLIAMGSSHRAGNEGMVALCDLEAGINNPRGIRAVTPYHSPIGRGTGSEMRPVEEGGVPYIGGYYVKPVALTPKTFLVSAGYDMPESCNYQAYYIDVWGNRELLHRDKMMEAVAVMPVRPREKPPILAETRDESKNYATCYVDNVYRDLPGVEKGQIKYLRILEQLFWFSQENGGLKVENTDTFRRPGGTGQGLTRIIGTVPVFEDGSAMFEVPSEAPLYFQALDENFQGIQRMRTHVEFAPGEYRSCIGCHETRDDAVPVRTTTMAMGIDAMKPSPPPWGATTFLDFEEHIQPIFEKSCVSCHSGDKPDGGLLLTNTRDKHGYMQSYRSLFGLKEGESFPSSQVYTGDGIVKQKRQKEPDHPWWTAMNDKVMFFFKATNGEVTQPYQFGSPQAPLAQKLVKDPEHHKLLTQDQIQTIMAWLDVRAPYFSHYFTLGRDSQRVEVQAFEPFGEKRTHELVIAGEK